MTDTQAPNGVGRVPEWTVGDRLRKARTTANVTTEEMAEYIGRTVRTISNYETGYVHHVPKLVVLAYAARCGVPADWLLYGSATQPNSLVTMRYPTNSPILWLLRAVRPYPTADRGRTVGVTPRLASAA
jgi:transcriptional regulator with XRE-family HTH domain